MTIAFQCSSASRKFLNLALRAVLLTDFMFQCSSASRKFLKHLLIRSTTLLVAFQCSSASRKFLNSYESCPHVSVRMTFQCSSASRKFLNFRAVGQKTRLPGVSVLFSEPKIPQRINRFRRDSIRVSFSALPRAENSSIRYSLRWRRRRGCFSALQRAENSSTW